MTATEIASKIGCGCRLTDFDPVGNGRYDVVMVANRDLNGLTWWYVGVSQSQVLQYLSTNGARTVELEPEGSGRFPVIMVRDCGSGSIRFDQSWSTLTTGPPSGTRYIDIRQYRNNAGADVWLSIGMKGV